MLNNRDDTPFWRFARNELACPDSLAERLELWRHKLPTAPDLPDRLALFSEWSYMYVLFGKEYFDGIDFPSEDAVNDADFDEFLFAVARDRMLAEAPDHRAAIRAIRDAPPMPWYRPEGPGTTGPQDGDRDGPRRSPDPESGMQPSGSFRDARRGSDAADCRPNPSHGA